jgi:hypothetical protein
MHAAANHVKKNAEINPDILAHQVARFQRIGCAKTGGGERHPWEPSATKIMVEGLALV